MQQSRVLRSPRVVLAMAIIGACSRAPTVDWSAQENFFAVDKSSAGSESARLEFQSLIDAPARGVYDALAAPETYASFVDGVSESHLVRATDDTKVTEITQTVIGRQTRAEVQWTLHPERLQIEFKTLKSDGNYNDGSYRVIASPDGKRCYVISVYEVKEGGMSEKVPIGVFEGATREAYEKAARSIKRWVLTHPAAR